MLTCQVHYNHHLLLEPNNNDNAADLPGPPPTRSLWPMWRPAPFPAATPYHINYQ